MKFELLPIDLALLDSVSGITAVGGYRAMDLRIEALQIPTDENPKNGVIKMQIACAQSYAEMDFAADVEEPGVCVTNGYFLGQLPSPADAKLATPWKFKVVNNRLEATHGKEFKFDFELGEEGMHRYTPSYCETPINITHICQNVGQIASIIGGFVSRKAADATGVNGSVRITGSGNEVVFQATNGMTDAIAGTTKVPVQIEQPFDILLPVKQFDSWKNLPDDEHVFMGVDENHQLTINVGGGKIKLQHNTLSNLIDNMEDIAAFAQKFNLATSPEEFDELKMSMRYDPQQLERAISSATIYSDLDPTIIFTADGKVANIVVRTSTADSKVDLNNIDITKQGNTSINKSGFGLLNKLKFLRAGTKVSSDPVPPPPAGEEGAADAPKRGPKSSKMQKADGGETPPQGKPLKPVNDVDDYMIMHTFEGFIMIGTPDGSWVGITSEVSI